MKGKADLCMQKIASTLMSNTRFINNSGLFDGKMGIAIFFYHYARFTGNKMYEDFADSLIDNICDELHPGMTINFTNGLTGIGWGIEYLVQNRFLETVSDETFNKIDNAVYSGFMNVPFLIQNQDLNGLGLYFLARMRGRESDENNLKVAQIKTKLIYFIDSCERLLTKEKCFGLSVPNPSVEQLNSILFFLNQVKRLGLFPVKTNRLLNYIPNNSGYDTDAPNVDRYTFWSLAKEYRKGPVKNNLPYEIFSIALLDNENPNKIDEESMVIEFIRCNWNALLYQIDFACNETFKFNSEKVITLIVNDNYWNKLLDKLNADNMGLYSGLAGLGMSIIQFSESFATKEIIARKHINI